MPSLELSDDDIEELIAERIQAKRSRNFARADAIRNASRKGNCASKDGL
jgi:cysteinyl-tRNA synthetase